MRGRIRWRHLNIRLQSAGATPSAILLSAVNGRKSHPGILGYDGEAGDSLEEDWEEEEAGRRGERLHLIWTCDARLVEGQRSNFTQEH